MRVWVGISDVKEVSEVQRSRHAWCSARCTVFMYVCSVQASVRAMNKLCSSVSSGHPSRLV